MGLAENTKETELILYPNPASNQVTINCDSEGPKTLSVIDVAGRTIMTREMNQQSDVLPVNDLKKGTYFIHVLDHSSERVVVKQLIVE